MTTEHPLWQPSPAQVEASPMTAFMRFCEARAGSSFADYDSFHLWSITERGPFWDAVWDYCGIVGERVRQRFPIRATCWRPASSPKPS